MSFLNKLKAFPEFHNVDDCLDKLTVSTTKKQKAVATAYGNCYSEFARKQPDELQEPLFRVNNIMRQIYEVEKPADAAAAKVRSTLVRLRTLNEDIRAKKKIVTNAEDKADKSTKALIAAEKKVEALRMKKPGSIDLTRAQDECDAMLSMKQTDISTHEAHASSFVGDAYEYRKQVILCVIDAIEEYGAAKRGSVVAMGPYGEKITELGATLPDFEDRTLDHVQTKLQEIRNASLQ